MICGGSMDLLCEYLTPAQAPLFRAAGAALKAGLTGIWLLDVSRADAPVRDLYLDALPEGQPLVAGLHEGAEAVRPLLAGRKGRPGLVREGLVERYVEALDAPPVLLLCGGGHVSLETARLAHAAGFVVHASGLSRIFSNNCSAFSSLGKIVAITLSPFCLFSPVPCAQLFHEH